MAGLDESRIEQEQELFAGPRGENVANSGPAFEEPPALKNSTSAGDNHERRVKPMDDKDNASREHLSAARAFAFAASSSRFFGGALVSSARRRRVEMPAISSTAASNAPSFAFDGLLKPLIFLTNWSEAARISSEVTGGSKLKRVLIFLHITMTSRNRTPRHRAMLTHDHPVVVNLAVAKSRERPRPPVH